MIRELKAEDIDQVVMLHKQELPGFLSDIGNEFLYKFYQISLSIPEMFTIVEKQDEQIIGFVSCITSVKVLHKKIIFKDIWSFFFIFLRYFFTHPIKALKVLKIPTYPGFIHDNPELLTIAIDKRYQKQGYGKKLFAKVIREFQSKKIHYFNISVYHNLTSNIFYQKMNCRKIRDFDYLGNKMNYYQYVLDDNKKKLNLVLLTYDSLYANSIFLPLLAMTNLKVVAIVVSGCVLYNKNFWQSLFYLYKKHGLAYFTFKVIDQVLYFLTNFKKYLGLGNKKLLLWEAKKMGIPIIKIKDINNKSSVDLLRQMNPDIIISYFNQILRKDAIDIPKKACLNVHPGYLPDYRGVGSSFWAMVNGEKWGGVTVHILEEGIDTGDIFFRAKVAIDYSRSLHQHNFTCCQKGGELLVKTIQKIQQGSKKTKKQPTNDQYYSWPDKKSVAFFMSKGYKLISWKDLDLY